MWWLPRLIVGYVDLVCATVNESLKTVLHEVWSLVAQVVNGLSVVLLGFLHTPGFESHLEHRKRIKKRKVPTYEDRKRSTFAQLLTDDTEELAEGVDGEVGGKEGEEKLRYSPRFRINSRRKNNRGKGLTHTNSSPAIQNLNDLAHYHEHMTTGLLEDVFTNTMLLIDRCFLRVRLIIRSFLEIVTLSRMPPFPWIIISIIINPLRAISRIINLFQNMKKVPERMVHSDQLDVRRVKDIIEHAGYPYEQHKIVTDDGYILVLERIPNRNSKHVLYLQHGVFDSAFAWVATGTAALAYRSHDQGYDVFLGNFRGNGDREHVRKNITVAEYWNFSINEHAFKDYPSFINSILQLKRNEFASPIKTPTPLPKSVPVALSEPALTHLSSSLSAMSLRAPRRDLKKKEEINNNKDTGRGEGSRGGINKGEVLSGKAGEGSKTEEPEGEPQFRLSVVSHSMGAAATLMYIVQCRLQGIPHHISQAILLSPAGYHKKIPWVCSIVAPITELLLRCVSIHVFRFPSDTARVWTAKAYHDLMNSGALATLAAYMFSRFLFGGDIQDSTMKRVHNLAYNTFTGTSVETFRHFLQLHRSGKFQAYDYGKARNREIYGQSNPIDFLQNYDKIDIPIHFCVGLEDNLISPSNVMHHYKVLRDFHPDLAFLKAFSKNGHLEFTLGLDEPLLLYILETLALEKKST